MTWAVAEAKAKFSAVLDRAETEGPQVVRRRKQEFYVIAKEKLSSSPADSTAATGKRSKGRLTEFFSQSPLKGSAVRIGGVKLEPRHVEF